MHIPPRLLRSVPKQARDNYVPSRLRLRNMAGLCCDTSVTENTRGTPPHPGRMDHRPASRKSYACSFQNLPMGFVTKNPNPIPCLGMWSFHGDSEGRLGGCHRNCSACRWGNLAVPLGCLSRLLANPYRAIRGLLGYFQPDNFEMISRDSAALAGQVRGRPGV